MLGSCCKAHFISEGLGCHLMTIIFKWSKQLSKSIHCRESKLKFISELIQESVKYFITSSVSQLVFINIYRINKYCSVSPSPIRVTGPLYSFVSIKERSLLLRCHFPISVFCNLHKKNMAPLQGPGWILSQLTVLAFTGSFLLQLAIFHSFCEQRRLREYCIPVGFLAREK